MRCALAIALALSLACGARAAHADDSAGAPAPASMSSAAADSARFRALFTPENRRYARVRQVLAVVEPLYDVAILVLLLVSGLSARMRDVAHARARRRYVRVLVYLALFTLVMLAAEAPFLGFRDWWWEHRFGLSNQSFLAWAWEGIESAAIGLAIAGGLGLVALALALIERLKTRAWAWLALGMLPVLLAGVLIQPLVIDPAFNTFEPLPNAGLEAKLLDLARRSGIPARHVFEADKSRQTNKLNAYVSGFGPSQRIVLWDTSLQAFREDEILSVMGHEMGHYRLGHLWKGVALWSVFAFALFFAADRLARWALARFGPRWRVPSLHDEAAIPLVAAALGLLLFAAQPVVNGYSRRVEHEADRFGLDVTHDNDAAARSFFVMAERNRSDPYPPAFVRWLLYTHPTMSERVRFARTYHPWDGTAGPK